MIRITGIRSCRSALVRYSSTKTPLSVAFKTGEEDEEVRYRHQKNPVVPSLGNLKTRWIKLDAGQQDDIIAYLEDRMRGDWHQLTAEEKKAANYVWYGNWGPRDPKKSDMGNLYLWFGGSVVLTAAGLALYKFSSYNEMEEIPGIDY